MPEMHNYPPPLFPPSNQTVQPSQATIDLCPSILRSDISLQCVPASLPSYLLSLEREREREQGCPRCSGTRGSSGGIWTVALV